MPRWPRVVEWVVLKDDPDISINLKTSQVMMSLATFSDLLAQSRIEGTKISTFTDQPNPLTPSPQSEIQDE